MFDEEFLEHIISCFEDKGFYFDYEEDVVKDDQGNDQKTLHFKSEVMETEFECLAIITKYTDSFYGLLCNALFDQLLDGLKEPSLNPNLMRKIDNINGYIGQLGCCCYINKLDETEKLRMYTHTFLPSDTIYTGFLRTFLDVIPFGARSLLINLID